MLSVCPTPGGLCTDGLLEGSKPTTTVGKEIPFWEEETSRVSNFCERASPKFLKPFSFIQFHYKVPASQHSWSRSTDELWVTSKFLSSKFLPPYHFITAPFFVLEVCTWMNYPAGWSLCVCLDLIYHLNLVLWAKTWPSMHMLKLEIFNFMALELGLSGENPA